MKVNVQRTPTYSLTLTEREARALVVLSANVIGTGVIRKVLGDVYDALKLTGHFDNVPDLPILDGNLSEDGVPYLPTLDEIEDFVNRGFDEA